MIFFAWAGRSGAGQAFKLPSSSTLLAVLAVVGAVYMAAVVVAAATPTPGGVGGFETAAIAGLTGIGISSAAAVSAVVIYRLATYWLPVPPGWVCWRQLQRRGYV